MVFKNTRNIVERVEIKIGKTVSQRIARTLRKMYVRSVVLKPSTPVKWISITLFQWQGAAKISARIIKHYAVIVIDSNHILSG